jgi:hypothetical protein
MLIKMTENTKGCDDGFTSREYVAGEQYEVSDSLADNFIQMNVAEKAKGTHENKSLDEGDYQNKSTKKRK